MGNANGESDEQPAHSVTVNNFLLAKTEVTQIQWRAVMGVDTLMLALDDCTKCPIQRVSWDDIQEFIKKLNAKTGKSYRLPTEVEWEYAARGGQQSHGYQYAGSNDVEEVAWYLLNLKGKIQPVGKKKPNELGLYDLSGNAAEWCQDWYGSYSTDNPSNNPKGPNSGSSRVVRGGSFNDYPASVRVTFRDRGRPNSRSLGIGFRLALDQ